MLTGYEGPTKALEDDAKIILHLVHDVYPGHPWYIRCAPGIVYIRHLGLPGNKPWGMNIRVTEFDHDSAVLKKKIIMLAGEWLERCGFSRSRLPQQGIEKVEGIG